MKRARLLLNVGAGTIVVLSAVLLTLLLEHDFSNGYVYSYSSRDLPLHFLISSFYAGQEGSFMFWALCSALIGLPLMWYTRKRKSEQWVMAVFMAVQAVLLLLLYAKTPFKSVWETIPQLPAGELPADGRGLNPLLQNFWMVIHPPVLFIGFAVMAVPFSFAIAGMWKNDVAMLGAQALGWLLFSVFILGTGIMLGAYWAYGVLGWGGYWGWDPVENSSLVPWLTGVALVHTLIVQRRTGKFVRLNLALAIVSFLLVIYSTFLTRSGVLGDASVHSFVDPGAVVYWLLVASLVAIAATGFGLMFARRKVLRPAQADNQFISKETALATGAIALVLSAAVILFGTSLPLIGKSTVDTSFYNTMNLPLVIAMVLFIGLSLYTQWGEDKVKEVLKRALKWVVVSLAACIALFFAGVTDVGVLTLIFTSAFALFVNLDFGWKQGVLDIRAIGGKLAHIGLAVFLLGVIASGRFNETKQASLPLNRPVEALGHTLTYTGYAPTPDNKYAFHVKVEKNGSTFTLSPVMFDGGQQGMMRNPDIKSFLTSDFYISPISLEQPEPDHAEHGDTYTIEKGKTIALGQYKATFVKFDMNTHSQEAMAGGGAGEMTVGAVLELSDGKATETVTPIMTYAKDGRPTYNAAQSKLLNAPIQLTAMNVGGMGSASSSVTIEVLHPGEDGPQSDALIVEASIKPFIGLVWVGTLIMFIGFFVAMMKRLKEA
ncbi:MAG TPA: hypothetical protein DGH68_06345 [Bacteroidetes bacterium]|nr:hypothetical protein [Bacteroidota bacterium]